MSAADEILAQIPLDQLASQLGMDPADAENAVRQAVPALLGGMEANAQDPGGAASLQHAIGQHAGDPFDGRHLDPIDVSDGEKIVGHVFGDNQQEVVNRLGGGEGGGGIMGKLLPILAPMVMAWLAGKLGGGQSQGSPAAAGEGGLDDLLGGLTGGGSGAGGGIGDLLGGLLGGGGGSSSAGAGDMGDIGDLLGGLLGGGSKG